LLFDDDDDDDNRTSGLPPIQQLRRIERFRLPSSKDPPRRDVLKTVGGEPSYYEEVVC
jgi:hypothetical protein